MAKRSVRQHQRKHAPALVFVWRRPRTALLEYALATLAVGVVFLFVLTSVHIGVAPPKPWATHKAAVIQVADDAEGRDLTMRAQAGGPFPSRFDPGVWEGASAIEQTAMEVTRRTPPYVPVLHHLPTAVTPPLALAAKGEATLPKLGPEAPDTPRSVRLRLVPTLYPLSARSTAALPRELPQFVRAVDATLAAESWRFLVRLDSAGNVLDCVSLAGGDEAAAMPLETWLRRVSFNPEPASPCRWIAVGVGFTNQPADGPDVR